MRYKKEIHFLKTESKHFEKIFHKKKDYTIRLNLFKYQIGDFLSIEEVKEKPRWLKFLRPHFETTGCREYRIIKDIWRSFPISSWFSGKSLTPIFTMTEEEREDILYYYGNRTILKYGLCKIEFD